MKRIAQSPATRTTSETPTRIISLAVYEAFASSTEPAASATGMKAKEISIN
jgi:hypothetical protein